MSFDKEIPSKGDTVRVTNTDSGDIVVERNVQEVTRYVPDGEVGDPFG